MRSHKRGDLPRIEREGWQAGYSACQEDRKGEPAPRTCPYAAEKQATVFIRGWMRGYRQAILDEKGEQS